MKNSRKEEKSEIEYSEEIVELAKRYQVQENVIDYLLRKYGSIDQYYKMYTEGKVPREDLKFGIIKNVVDINSSDNPGYTRLYRLIFGIDIECTELHIFSSESLQEILDEWGKNGNLCKTREERYLNLKSASKIESHKLILEILFGLDGSKPGQLRGMTKKVGIRQNDLINIENDALHILRHLYASSIRIDLGIENMGNLTEGERANVDQLVKYLQLGEGKPSINVYRIKSIIKEANERKSLADSQNGVNEEEKKNNEATAAIGKEEICNSIKYNPAMVEEAEKIVREDARDYKEGKKIGGKMNKII